MTWVLAVALVALWMRLDRVEAEYFALDHNTAVCVRDLKRRVAELEGR